MKEKKKLPVFKHFILTRFNNGIYDRDDAVEWMEHRMELFKDSRDSVLSQDGEFEWILSIDERTPDRVVDEILTDKRMKAVTYDIRDSFKDYEGSEFVITSRFDNDDLYLPGAIEAIQAKFQPQLYVIDIDYMQYYNGEYYTSGNKSKGELKRMLNNGPFLSLVEPAINVKTCYSRPHTHMPFGYPFEDGNRPIANTKIEEPYAVMVIHSENLANKVTGYKI